VQDHGGKDRQGASHTYSSASTVESVEKESALWLISSSSREVAEVCSSAGVRLRLSGVATLKMMRISTQAMQVPSPSAAPLSMLRRWPLYLFGFEMSMLRGKLQVEASMHRSANYRLTMSMRDGERETGQMANFSFSLTAAVSSLSGARDYPDDPAP